MRSKAEWRPTKYELHRGKWRSARGRDALASRLMADLQAAEYDRVLRAHARGRLIDLGCGNAPLAGLYRDLAEHYTWADWPNSPHREFSLDLEVDLNRPLPLADGSYDTVLLSDVLEHIAQPDGLFGELARILAPGGKLIVGVPFLYWIHEEPHDHHRYTRYQLAAFGERHGLRVLEVAEVGGGLDTLCDLSGKMLGAVWPPLAAIPYYVWRGLRPLPPFRGMNQRAAKRFPLAYVAVYGKETSR